MNPVHQRLFIAPCCLYLSGCIASAIPDYVRALKAFLTTLVFGFNALVSLREIDWIILPVSFALFDELFGDNC